MTNQSGSEDVRARRGVEAVFERYHKLAKQKSGDLFDYDCMSRSEIIHVCASDNSVVFKFTPSQHYANLNDVVHGGAMGVLFDMFTMAACGTIAKENYWEFMGGVSRSINISFLKAVPVGRVLYFRSRVVQHGRTMALIQGEATDETGKVIYATCEHHKVNVPMRQAHREVKIEFDDVLREEARKSRGNKNAKL